MEKWRIYNCFKGKQNFFSTDLMEQIRLARPQLLLLLLLFTTVMSIVVDPVFYNQVFIVINVQIHYIPYTQMNAILIH